MPNAKSPSPARPVSIKGASKQDSTRRCSSSMSPPSKTSNHGTPTSSSPSSTASSVKAGNSSNDSPKRTGPMSDAKPKPRGSRWTRWRPSSGPPNSGFQPPTPRSSIPMRSTIRIAPSARSSRRWSSNPLRMVQAAASIYVPITPHGQMHSPTSPNPQTHPSP